MKPVKNTSKEFAQKIGSVLNLKLFSQESYNCTRNTQINLAGKTHYTDSDTLRYFHSRIVASSDTENGLIFWFIESAAKDCNNTSRGFRYVAFDLFGTVLCRVDLADMTSTSEKARKQFWTWLETFDTIGHYKNAFKQKALQAKKDAIEFSKLAK